MWDRVRHLSRWGLGTCFIVAGILKLEDAFAAGLHEPPSVPVLLGHRAAPVVGVVEAALGAWVISGALCRASVRAAQFCVLVFAAVHGFLILQGSNVQCGCLGRRIETNSPVMLCLLGGMLLLSCMVEFTMQAMPPPETERAT